MPLYLSSFGWISTRLVRGGVDVEIYEVLPTAGLLDVSTAVILYVNEEELGPGVAKSFSVGMVMKSSGGIE